MTSSCTLVSGSPKTDVVFTDSVSPPNMRVQRTRSSAPPRALCGGRPLPNKNVQRTRASPSPPHSPLTRGPLGGPSLSRWVLVVILLGTGCSSADLKPDVTFGKDRNPPCTNRVPAIVIRRATPDLTGKSWKGKFAIVEGFVHEDGEVGEIRPVDGNDLTLMRLTLASARDWKFSPGSCDGQPERQYVCFVVDGRRK